MRTSRKLIQRCKATSVKVDKPSGKVSRKLIYIELSSWDRKDKKSVTESNITRLPVLLLGYVCAQCVYYQYSMVAHAHLDVDSTIIWKLISK